MNRRLEQYEDNWRTSMGGAILGDRVILRDKDLFDELAGNRWYENLVFAITGRMSPRIAALMEAIWVIATSYPDPRIWNNRVSALAGTARSTGVLAAAGTLAVTEATAYGLKPIKGSMDFLYRARAQLSDGAELADVVKKEIKTFRSIYGYGRPLVGEDERIQPLMKRARELKCGQGPYIDLAFAIDRYLQQTRYKLRMNIAVVSAGLLADEGITPQQLYHMATLAFTGGAIPCYIDAMERPEGCFFPLRTSRIDYRGAAPRPWSPK